MPAPPPPPPPLSPPTPPPPAATAAVAATVMFGLAVAAALTDRDAAPIHYCGAPLCDSAPAPAPTPGPVPLEVAARHALSPPPPADYNTGVRVQHDPGSPE